MKESYQVTITFDQKENEESFHQYARDNGFNHPLKTQAGSIYYLKKFNTLVKLPRPPQSVYLSGWVNVTGPHSGGYTFNPIAQ